MSRHATWSVLALLIVAGSANVATAGLTPTFDNFGTLSEATFGGTGIPNDAVAITNISSDGNTITLGLTAHQRFSNPPLSNDGAGTFTATTGANTGGPGSTSSLTGAKWNFAFFIKIDGGSFADFDFELLYDFDPAADTDVADHGVLDFNTAITASGGDLSDTTLVEGSQNLLFSFLANDSLSFIDAPTPASFDPDAVGEYSFALRAFDGETQLGQSAIVVNTVPEPGTFAAGLLGVSLAGGWWLRRRRAV